MKKVAFSILIFMVNIYSSAAQEKRINLYGGYVFDDAIDVFNDDYQYVNGVVKGGFQYGGSIEFITPSEVGIELMYIGQNTTLPVTFNSNFLTGSRLGENEFNLNYALVSVNKYSRQGKMEGYGGLMLGCLFSNLNNTSVTDSSGYQYSNGLSTSSTRFSWGLKLGLNYWISENVGIKAQAQFLSTTEAVGSSSYYGYYGGFYTYSTYINLFQWNFSSGLVFKFGSN